ncbi:DUF6266 family protein [Aquiflexum lacus]|uniref:DUF6266 family protein n=1 Tax=Aquiflexum lacus TaxID=2483805 RepID=UPI0018934E90|nr:DUF6266 family protein [Aquiflexum lacus]
MAKVIESTAGIFNGKIGGIVYYQVGGKTYVRKAPPKQTKAQKKNVSPLKKLYQNKMTLTQSYLKPLTKAIAFGFQEFENGARRPFHACVSYTLNNCFVSDGLKFAIDPSLFKISQGSLLPPENAKAEKVEDGIEISWNNDSQTSNAKPWDKAFIVLHNPERNLATYIMLGNDRSSKSQFIPLASKKLNSNWHVYLAFSQEQSHNGKMLVSDSVYLGCL